ncbi:hypothetical protein OIV83_003998 [Microbotryomycetes sp. JL201]|nr:hypothetical protein OIV83_003998 [Microbotryomycetes sp. JL201]
MSAPADSSTISRQSSGDSTRAPSPSADSPRDKHSNKHAREPDLENTETETTLQTYKRQLKRSLELTEARGLEPTTASLSVSWNHLSVRGLGGRDDMIFAPTVGSILAAPIAAAQDKRHMRALAEAKKQQAKSAGLVDENAEQQEQLNAKNDGRKLKKGERFLLDDLSGIVKPGEVLLVVGRPGAGCTTFLKTLAGLTQGFAGIDGEIRYGNQLYNDGTRPIKSAVQFVSEVDIHDPNLFVGRTMDFALANKTPARAARPLNDDEATVPSADEYDEATKASLLKIFGLEHTINTRVGDEYVRGVSGGEKKRTTLAEALTTRAAIQCYDQPSRGLDANTALEFAKIVRIQADVRRTAVAMSLYQASNGIYDLVDKVLVIAEGQVLYYGPRSEAKAYMEDIGFQCPDGANIADYLTSVTVATERKIRDGFQDKVPKTIAEFSRRYRDSDVARRMREELDSYLSNTDALDRETRDAKAVVQREKHKYAIKREPHTTSFARQVKASLIREYQQRWGDKYTFWARQATTLVQALVAGSTFYMAPQTTGGLFTRGGVMFLSLLFPSLISLAETTAAFENRAVLSKHKAYSLQRPSAVVLAQTIADVPIFFIQLAIFCVIVYFMTGLKMEAGAFFFYYLFVFITTLSTVALFRFIGNACSTFNDASKYSGTLFSILVTYAGYIIPTSSMKPWFGWFRWINPVYFSFEALMASEFRGQTFQCVPPQLAPYGPGYDGQPAGCAAPGAAPGALSVDGEAYLDLALNLGFKHAWRNFGIVVGLWLAFVVAAMYAAERIPAAGSTKGFLLYKRGGGKRFIEQTKAQSERGASASNGPAGEKVENKDESRPEDVTAVETVFTWQNLSYTVHSGGQELKLLDNVQGWCKPGELTAQAFHISLMGSSGAGKTTLMDVLAQRKTEGDITGEVLINGQSLPLAFQRTTGYCEQVTLRFDDSLDIHMPQATVREALEFSALLRQPRTLSRKDKLAYVDVIIDLLELHDIEDALVGVPGNGLGVEQRKRLTLGVELVAKPTLLFCDEPTSGMDGQSSYRIAQFLRKLAAAGQSCCVVVHQPSAQLFSMFDNLLLMKKGGKTVYFGPVKKVPDYFASKGIEFPRDVNPAEMMIDVVSGDLARDRDWARVWDDSDEAKAVTEELEQLKRDNKDKPAGREDDGYKFAVPLSEQIRLVTSRANVQIYRNTDYVVNKVMLHIGSALINGFSFWMIGNSYADLQNRLFTIFQFLFIAPGVIAQLQPKFLANRDIYEKRERKAAIYSWWAFIVGEIVAEIPYLLVCAFLYWACWYPVVGFTFRARAVAPLYLQMTLYELAYTSLGQTIAAYSPNATFAALVNPVVISIFTIFSGVLIPYSQITAFWRYWIYWIDVFHYIMSGLLVWPIWNEPVVCKPEELARFAPPAGQTCGAYMAEFLSRNSGYVVDPDSTSECAYCIYSQGSEYLQSLNISKYWIGWRDIGITALFCVGLYALVFVMMRLRTKATKRASKA